MRLDGGWKLAIIRETPGTIYSCQIPDWPGRPGLVARILSMYEQHGLALGERCKTCRHLERYKPPRYEDGLGYDAEGFTTPKVVSVEWGASFPKCRAFSKENGSTTDWRLNWPACGLWRRANKGGTE